jgi:predicted membrane-bound spermidine synthase
MRVQSRVDTVSLRHLLGFMLFLSGGAALTYQVAWQRILSLFYGVGPVSTAIVVSVFMFGLGMGGLAAGWVSHRTTVGVRAYLVLEIGIGLFGVVSVSVLRLLGEATAGADLWLVAVASFAFLCIPTMLMGATLPIVIQIFSRLETRLLSNLSFFYFINTLGAATGAFVGAFLIVTFVGLDGAVYIAAAVNIALGALIFLVPKAGAAAAEPLVPPAVETPRSSSWAVLALIFVTGFLAIGYQIIWFRISGILLKDSPYAFASILGVYLFGIAAGSRWIQQRQGLIEDAERRSFFFLLNASIAISVAATIAVFVVLVHLPGVRAVTGLVLHQMVLPVIPGMASNPSVLQSVGSFAAIVLWPAFFMIVPTFLMGASFPLATSLLPHKSAASTVGTAYFVAVVGNALGALVTGFVLLSHWGTDWTLSAFLIVGLMFVFGVRREVAAFRRLRAAAAVAFVGVVVWAFVPAGWLYRSMHANLGKPVAEHVEEGVEGVVLAQRIPPYIYNFINGSAHGAYPGPGYFRATYAALATASRARSVLVIGFGVGSVTEAALSASIADRVHLVEINGSLLQNLSKFDEPRAVLQNLRLDVTIDDARRDLLRNPRRYDVVLMDPLRTTTQFSNNIYSLEFLELVKTRLNPGGVLMIWTDNLSVLPRTVAEVFPHVSFFRQQCSFMLASMQPVRIDPGRFEPLVAASPGSVREDVRNSPCLKSHETRQDILDRTAGVPVNRDMRPVAEYYLRGYH